MASAEAAPGSTTPESVRYEVAEEILTILRTSSGGELRAARENGPAGRADLAVKEDVHAKYTQLRAALHRQDPDGIEAIIRDYGPLARMAVEAAAP